MSRYRFAQNWIWSEKNKTMRMAATMNGPKGIWLFQVFFLSAISPRLTTDPMRYVRKNTNNIFGQPTMSPAKNPNFTSPPPIHFPFEIQIKKKKNKAAARAAKSALVRGE